MRITEADVQRVLTMPDAVRLMRETFTALGTGEAQNQPRRRLMLPSGAILHQLAGAFGPYFGVKIYSTHPQHGAHFTVLLYEAATGKPLAEIEANYLGQIRTGAATGAAIDLLAPAEADKVGLVGTGFQARTQLEAILAVRPIRRVNLWSRKPERREAFASECRDRFGIEAVAVESAPEAIAAMPIVVTMTSAKDPVFDGEDVAAGAVVAAAGSNNPQRRELPGDLLRRASAIYADSREQAKIEAGDLILGLPEAGLNWDDVRELSDLAAGRHQYRYQPDRVAVFKSIGLGVEDIAAAGFVYERLRNER